MKKKETWKFILQTLLSVLSAIATAFGVASWSPLPAARRNREDGRFFCPVCYPVFKRNSYLCSAIRQRIQ